MPGRNGGMPQRMLAVRPPHTIAFEEHHTCFRAAPRCQSLCNVLFGIVVEYFIFPFPICGKV